MKKRRINMKKKEEILKLYKQEVNKIFCSIFEIISESGISTNDIRNISCLLLSLLTFKF